ncbi:MAG: hypothetical protein ACI80F_000048 [Natronomonas sp.]|jgi:hypothetical protein|uniref:histidine kinase N-terminal 7TM domain-containing protein n=1 Tax=Natronomonas sp. TaxID=2184060 RepID=UPI00398911CC
MQFQFSYYLVPLVVSGGISALLAVFVFFNRHKRTAPQILAILVAATVWSVTEALILASVGLEWKLLWHNVRFFGSTLVVLAVFLHALEYTNREQWITRESVIALSAVLVVTNVLAWTELAFDHGLIRASYQLVQVESMTLIEFEFGPLFYVNAVYSYLLLFGAAGMYVAEFLRRSGTYRLQTGGLIIGTLVPWGMNGLYLLGYSVVDLTAFGFTVTGVVFVAQFYRRNRPSASGLDPEGEGRTPR